jgi:hypothetical protein
MIGSPIWQMPIGDSARFERYLAFTVQGGIDGILFMNVKGNVAGA